MNETVSKCSLLFFPLLRTRKSKTSVRTRKPPKMVNLRRLERTELYNQRGRGGWGCREGYLRFFYTSKDLFFLFCLTASIFVHCPPFWGKKEKSLTPVHFSARFNSNACHRQWLSSRRPLLLLQQRTPWRLLLVGFPKGLLLMASIRTDWVRLTWCGGWPRPASGAYPADLV